MVARKTDRGVISKEGDQVRVVRGPRPPSSMARASVPDLGYHLIRTATRAELED